ncbi:tripartite tricarboxylate transporter TctB family protein [Shumkonia mesophila]|uniref:tripartite tricarboxylate transporter TctB family protein n=1 Tax=Shumkonia mesophila TaxID=2838854 RepID=UPI002934BB9E|nr:tripartite tricarboxylate transporter TctB family protein [Shumkonia mesophila]
MRNSLRFGRRADLVFSCALLILGAVVTLAGWHYGLGYHLNDIGPGVFPVGLGVLLMVLALMSLREASGSREAHRIAPVLFIPLGIIAWGLLINTAGLLAATIALIALYVFGEPRLKPFGGAVLALSLTAAGYVLFVLGLKLSLHVFWG